MPLKPYFETGGVTLYNGDCRDVMRELPSGTVDLVLTDPPYLVSYTGRWGSDAEMIEGDSDPGWIAPAFVECWRVLKNDSLLRQLLRLAARRYVSQLGTWSLHARPA